MDTLIILASGTSARFKKAGYSLSKYLLPFAGKTILDHLISSASGFHIILVVNNDDYTNLDITINYRYRFLNPRIRILPIEKHVRGPVHSLNLIRDDIPPNATTHISYCDYHASSLITGDCYSLPPDCESSVLVYSGYHPHHIPTDNVYGYLKTNNEGIPIDYREKSCFTTNKLDEPCSAGLYSFRSGLSLIQSIDNVLQNPSVYEVNGELYISSLILNHIKSKRKVSLNYTEFFAQLGTPFDYQVHAVNALQSSIIRNKLTNPPRANCKVRGSCLILMTGAGSRFTSEGISTHKSLLPFANDSVILANIIDLLPQFDQYFIAVDGSRHDLHLLVSKVLASISPVHLIQLRTPTPGQAHSALYALNSISRDFPELSSDAIYIAPCDSLIVHNSVLFNESLHSSFCGYTYKSLENLLADPSSYSYLTSAHPLDYSQNNQPVQEVFLKQAPNAALNPQMLTGAFSFKSVQYGRQLLKAAIDSAQLINGESYLDSILNFYCSSKLSTFSTVADFLSLGTPTEYLTHNYWYSYTSLLSSPILFPNL